MKHLVVEKEVINTDAEKEYLVHIITESITNFLEGQGFAVDKYNLKLKDEEDTVFLKLDNGVCNSIRISDHVNSDKYSYKYNVILGGPQYSSLPMRLFYNEDTYCYMLAKILEDRDVKIKYYGGRGGYEGAIELKVRENREKRNEYYADLARRHKKTMVRDAWIGTSLDLDD